MNITLALKHAVLDRHIAAKMREIEADTFVDDRLTAARSTPAGDERRLRGIPAIGRGVQGAIPGTRP